MPFSIQVFYVACVGGREDTQIVKYGVNSPSMHGTLSNPKLEGVIPSCTPTNPKLEGVRTISTATIPLIKMWAPMVAPLAVHQCKVWGLMTHQTCQQAMLLVGSFSTEVGEKELDVVVDAIDVTLESFLSLKKKCTYPMQHSGTISTPSLPKP